MADPRIEKNRERYDRMSRYYERATKWSSFGTIATLYRAVADALDVAPGGSVLEFGCGPATVTPYLREVVGESGTVVGVDISEKMLAKAEEKKERLGWSNVRFERCDIADYSPTEKFDAVVFCLALTGLPDCRACLDKAVSALRPGGQLVVLDSFPNPSNPFANLMIHLKGPLVGARPTRIPLDYAEQKLSDVKTRKLSGGVYCLLSARAPVGDTR